MRSFTALTFCAVIQICASQGLKPPSPEDWAANWKLTMQAHRHMLQATPNGTGTCNNDMRKAMPPCLQFEENWCWATTSAEVSFYYKPELLQNKSDRYCEAIECKVVGNKLSPGKSPCCNSTKYCAPGKCCQSPWPFKDVSCQDRCRGFAKDVDDSVCQVDSCKLVSGEIADCAQAVTDFSGKKYVSLSTGPLNQTDLDTILNKGHPIVIGVAWGQGGGHALVLGGCGDGHYYLHDSLDKSNAYQTLTYEQLLTYTPPWGRSNRGQWFGQAYPDGVLAASESIVV